MIINAIADQDNVFDLKRALDERSENRFAIVSRPSRADWSSQMRRFHRLALALENPKRDPLLNTVVMLKLHPRLAN
jgi:hypothetical protein